MFDRDSPRPSESTPIVDYACGRLSALCEAASFGSEAPDVLRTFRSLLSDWGDRPISDNSGWVSEVSDDNAPIEFSVAISDGRADVRVLFEPPGLEPTVSSYRAAALAFHERLEREFGASLERFRQIRDIFAPPDAHGPFVIWSSAVFSPGRKPAYKAYFNPLARGTEQAERITKEALQRLGLGGAWKHLAATALRRGPELDELKYFALDLTSGRDARVKVLVRHHAATVEDLERAGSAALGHVPGEAADFVRAMAPGVERFRVRAPFTCSAFISSADPRPASTTVYVPVCAYARDDQVVRARVRDFLTKKALDSRPYDSIVEGFPNRRLEDGVGMQAWVAQRRYSNALRLTVYLNLEARRVCIPGEVPAPTEDRSSLVSKVTLPAAGSM